MSDKKQYPHGMWEQVEDALKKLEKAMGAAFGDPDNPLLVLRPLRRAVLDAGHDGHGPEPRA